MTKYNHQEKLATNQILREVVFGLEDGMVSTLGALTGVAVGSQDHFTVLLTGAVVISVESISMGIGAYLSNKSQQEADNQKIKEEKEEIRKFPSEEKEELRRIFIRDGWPEKLAKEMSEVASRNSKLMLKDMSYRELGINPNFEVSSCRKGLSMFLSYVIGGAIPLIAYFFFSISRALGISVAITFLGLFLLGILISKYTKRWWFVSGMRILLFGGTAFVVGYFVGEIAKFVR